METKEMIELFKSQKQYMNSISTYIKSLKECVSMVATTVFELGDRMDVVEEQLKTTVFELSDRVDAMKEQLKKLDSN